MVVLLLLTFLAPLSAAILSAHLIPADEAVDVEAEEEEFVVEV